MDQFDVIVAGGGPAGSTAARECATAGLKVALLDRVDFPRDKPCGGGVTLRCAALLPFDLAPVCERDITSVCFTAPGASIHRSASGTLTYLTQRRHLDTFLLDRARESGTTVMLGQPVSGVQTEPEYITVTSGSLKLRTRYLVAADGANGVTARLAGITLPTWRGIALEGNISTSPFPARWQKTIGVDFGHIRGGYGWLFPKGDHVNVGLGGWLGSGPTLRTRLDALTRWYGFDPAGFWNLRGHPLPVRKPGAPVALGRVLLAGDAAGLLDPFTGEGIFAAIWSGKSAARQIVAGLHDDSLDVESLYVDDVRANLLSDLRVSRKLADLFHVAPWLWTQGIRAGGVWNLAQHLLTGGQTYVGASRSAGWRSSVLSGLYESLKLLSLLRSGADTPRPLLFGA